MRRVCTLVGVTAIALFVSATVTRAATRGEPRPGEVKSLSVIPSSGRAEVVIAVDGSVDIQDFSMASPPRVVLDVKGATLSAPPRLYDRVTRGGVTNVRVAQYRDDVVRVVIDLDAEHKYTVTRGQNEVRVAIDGSAASFSAWHAAPELADGFASAATARRAKRATESSLRPASPQPRITVTYQDADIRDVIAAFAVFSGRTIVVGKGVSGTVSAEVRDQPWDVALRAILQTQGLAAKEDQDGIIAVDSYQNIAAQQASEPLTTQILSVNYARATSLVPTIKSLLSKDCPATAPGSANGAEAACK